MKAKPTPWRFVLLVVPSALLALSARPALSADDAPTPPAEPQTDAQPAADDDDTPWGVSADPNTRFWDVMYLKGTTPELRNTLNSQVVEFDEKLADVLAELAKNDRDAASGAQQAIAALRERPDYRAASDQANAAKAEVEAARSAGMATDQRMAASSRYNKLKADLDRMERDAVAKTNAAALKAARPELQRRADTFRARRTESLAWRQKIVDAIIFGQTIHGSLEPGETIGLIMDATVERVTKEKDVLARFSLLTGAKVIGEKEGVKQLQGRKREVRLLLKKLDDVQKLQPHQRLGLPFAFKVTGVERIDGDEAYVLEPYPCDFNHLMTAMTTLPPLKVPMDPPKATAPAKKTVESK